MSQEVAAEFVPALKGEEPERIKTKSLASFTAWDNYLKGSLYLTLKLGTIVSMRSLKFARQQFC